MNTTYIQKIESIHNNFIMIIMQEMQMKFINILCVQIKLKFESQIICYYNLTKV